MFPPLVRRFVAALLAFWLPLQLGTAFAVAAPMQVAGAAGIETVGHAGHHRSTSMKPSAGPHASAGANADAVPTGEARTSHDHSSHDDCHEATASASGPRCASSAGLDGASCVKCAFCFASAVALAAAVPKAFDVVARSAPIVVVVAALDSRALIPPDPPPIA